MKFGTRNINFSEKVLKMNFEEFQKVWNESGFEKRTGLTVEKAARKLKIKVPTKIEGAN